MLPVVVALGVIGAAVTIDYVAKKIREREESITDKSVEDDDHDTITVVIDGKVIEGIWCKD